jgi:hypothetical protein
MKPEQAASSIRKPLMQKSHAPSLTRLQPAKKMAKVLKRVTIIIRIILKLP